MLFFMSEFVSSHLVWSATAAAVTGSRPSISMDHRSRCVLAHVSQCQRLAVLLNFPVTAAVIQCRERCASTGLHNDQQA